MVREFNGEGPLFFFGRFLQTEEWTTEELCGPHLWARNRGHRAGLGEFAFPGAPRGPTSCVSTPGCGLPEWGRGVGE